MDQKNLADLYGLDPIPWSRALEALESGEPRTQTPFLATTRPGGRPHVAALGALWDVCGQADHCLRGGHGRARRCHTLALRCLTA